MTKFIFITGGVVSSLGKGITASCIGRLLKSRGLKVFMQKLDPYLNYDPGTMSPYQHGEVFITADGAETDLDLGHYERFINEELNKSSNVTTGKIYSSVIKKERQGYYGGSTVQVIPHITNEIKSYIKKASEATNADVVITEIGGTVGDIESLPFLEAIRQVRRDVGYNNSLYIHVTLVPYLKSAKEIKTKPTQHSVKELKSLGIQPDMVVLRSEVKISKEQKDKIALFCDVNENAVFEATDMKIVYELVNSFHKQGMDDYVCNHFGLETKEVNLTSWNNMISKIKAAKDPINIALVGKYTSLNDAYLSVHEALKHAGYEYNKAINVVSVDSETITEENVGEMLKDIDGILVPGGFGIRGVEGKILTSKYARDHKIPYFGICLGMQIAIIDILRHVKGYSDANSTEFNASTSHPVIDYLPGQYDGINIGGTLRLGNYKCDLTDGTKIKELYKEDSILERHRHRYEFNNDFYNDLESCGVKVAGKNPDNNLVEMIELENHPYFVGCQFHPEFKSRPNHPHPLFLGLIEASIKNRESK